MATMMPHNTLPQRAVESKNASRIQPHLSTCAPPNRQPSSQERMPSRQVVNDLPCESVLPSNVGNCPPMVSRTPIDCLKTSFWSGSLHPVFVNLGGNQRAPFVREPSFASRWLLLFTGEKPHICVSAAAGGIHSCGNVACRMCRERNRNPVITSRPLHTMPTVGNTPRCSRLSPSAEEPMVRTLHKIRRETPLTRPCRASGTTAKR